MSRNNQPSRVPVSIVCVYNDPVVFETCLGRSVADGRSSAPDTELVAIDNRGNPFTTAGAALNHGATAARNDVVVFVHQDVVLHSLVALEEAAAILMSDHRIGILGAVGIDARHTIVGRIRDRVVPIGDPAGHPRDVDSLDEVLFMIRREQVLAEPLSEHRLLAWHAYGVEYCARMRHTGRRAVALDIPLTHNSLTTNLKDLDLAHRHVGDSYPDLLPMRTTCGTIWREAEPGLFARQRRRVRGAGIWWRESLEARALSQLSPTSEIVLADVRLIVDEALDRGGKRCLRVIDLEREGLIPTSASDLQRFGRPFSVTTASPAEVAQAITGLADDELLLVTAGSRAELARLGVLQNAPHVIGYTRDTGLWALVGAAPATLAPLWSSRRTQPFAGLLRTPRVRAAIGVDQA